MGINAKDLHLLSFEPDSIKEIVSKVECKQHLFTLSVKMETFKDIECLKVIIMRLEHLDFEAGNKLLLHKISKFQQA
jgi:hypothetical protein